MTEHGTRKRYRQGCRCDECRRAQSEYNKKWYRTKVMLEGRKVGRPVAQHGTMSKYTAGCKCAACMEAHKLYRRLQNRRAGYREKLPAQRIEGLIRCMIDFGLQRKRIAAAAGVTESTLRLTRPEVLDSTVKKIEGLHWLMHKRYGPFRKHCKCEGKEDREKEILDGDLVRYG